MNLRCRVLLQSFRKQDVSALSRRGISDFDPLCREIRFEPPANIRNAIGRKTRGHAAGLINPVAGKKGDRRERKHAIEIGSGIPKLGQEKPCLRTGCHTVRQRYDTARTGGTVFFFGLIDLAEDEQAFRPRHQRPVILRLRPVEAMPNL